MANEPDNLVLRILQEIQATQKDHGRVLRAHTREFERLRNGQKEIRESIVTALGLSAHANVRHDLIRSHRQAGAMIEEVAELRERVARLETEEA